MPDDDEPQLKVQSNKINFVGGKAANHLDDPNQDSQRPKPSHTSGVQVPTGAIAIQGNSLFREARELANMREIVQDVTVAEGQQGPRWNRSVWEYYSVLAHWS